MARMDEGDVGDVAIDVERLGGPVKRLRSVETLARATDPWRVLAHSAVGRSGFCQQHLGLEFTREILG